MRFTWSLLSGSFKSGLFLFSYSVVSDSFVTSWTVACQAPLSTEFSRQEYWSGLSFPSPGDLPNPGIKPLSLLSPALAGGFLTNCASWEVPCVHAKSLSRVRLFAIPWTVAHQAPLSMEFSRHEYWSGLSFPSPGDLSDPGIKPRSAALQADSLPSEPPGKPIIWCP